MIFPLMLAKNLQVRLMIITAIIMEVDYRSNLEMANKHF